MIINRVKLTNYRNHKNRTIEFSAGINLLLGNNGCGKTSALEAVGFALFNAGLRDSHTDAVSLDESSGQIVVEFTGNDGISYRVERKIGSGNKKVELYVSGERAPRLKNAAEVFAKTFELAGIEPKNGKTVYEDVITARQNMITTMFSQSNSDRRRFFNQIFDTEIYETIFGDKYLLDIKRKYESRLEALTAQKKSFSDMLKDPDELNQNYLTHITKKSKADEQISLCLKEIDVLEQNKSALDKIKNEIENNAQNISKLHALLQQTKAQIEQQKKSVEESRAAQAVIEQSRSGYEQFNANAAQLQLLDKEIKSLEKMQKEHDSIKEQINALSIAKARLEADSKSKAENREILLEHIRISEEEMLALSDELAKMNEEQSDAAAVLNELTDKGKELKSALEELNKQNSILQKNLGLIDEIGSGLIPAQDLRSQLPALAEEKQKLAMLKSAQKDFEHRKAELLARLSDNDKAWKKLGRGICPYLKENCMNVEQNGSADDFFKEKERELKTELALVEEELNKFSNIDSLIETNSKQSANIEKEIENAEKQFRRIESLRRENTELLLKIENSELRIKHQTEFLDREMMNEAEKRDYAAVISLFDRRVNEAKENLAVLSSRITEKQNTINTSLLKINKERTQVDELQADIERLEQELLTNLKDGKILEEKKLALAPALELLPQKKSIRDEISEKQTNLKIQYDAYVKNIDSAEALNKRKAELSDTETMRNKFENELMQANELKATLQAQWNEDEYNKLQMKILSAVRNKESYIADLAAAKEKIDAIEAEIDENNKLIEKLDFLSKDISKQNRKIALLNVFRNSVKMMGSIVASRLLRRVESEATASYRKISGKNEFIIWKNDDIQSYLICLRNSNGIERKFEQLSGGEQVSVALAVRAAIASTLTNASFAIFDEPTNNLDKCRREALSESLKESLRGLKQAIIVTHDDTFREMAQKVIEI